MTVSINHSFLRLPSGRQEQAVYPRTQVKSPHGVIVAGLVVLAIAVMLTGCPTPATPAPTSPATPAAQTMGQLAELGRTVYAGNCAGCHGNDGQGGQAPALVGTNANLGKYNTAAGLFAFVSTAMPALKPGALTATQYQQSVAFLLVQNGFASASTPFDPNGLDRIALKK